MKKIIVVALLCVLCACSSSQKREASGTYQNEKGETTSAKLILDQENIIDVELDETTGDTTKKTLGDEYHMKEASSIGKEWKDQVQFLETYIKQNGIQNIKLNEEGKAENEDILTGCTISIDGFLKAIENAMKQ